MEGAKGVGKTATASRRAAQTIELDQDTVGQAISADPRWIEADPGTVLLDEWQRAPAIWDYVRRQVDVGAPAGRYLLTGSAIPTQAPSHSGAGRIVQLRMRPLSLAERELAAPTVSLAQLLAGERPAVSGVSPVSLSDYVEEILGSGFPGIRGLSGRARRSQLRGYLARVVERDFPEQGLRVRRPATLYAWLAAYAAATSTTASYNTLLAASTAGLADKPAKSTTSVYRDILSQLRLLDPVPGWTPGRNHLSTLTQSPKHHLADPALAAHLLGVGADALLTGSATYPAPQDGTLLGQLFESLVTQSVRVYAQQCESTVHHLRLPNGRREVDLIVQRPDHKVVAFEVKLGLGSAAQPHTHLPWLRDLLGPDLLDAAIITAGREAYRRPDGIAVIPAALLGV